MGEKVIDAITILIREIYVTLEFLPPPSSDFTSLHMNEAQPKTSSHIPKLAFRLNEIEIRTVDSMWNTTDPKKCREFNEKKKHIYVFKLCQIQKISVSFLTMAPSESSQSSLTSSLSPSEMTDTVPSIPSTSLNATTSIPSTPTPTSTTPLSQQITPQTQPTPTAPPPSHRLQWKVIPIITNIPVSLKITMKKDLNNRIEGLQIDSEIRSLKLNFDSVHLSLFSLFSDAFVMALAKPIPESHLKLKKKSSRQSTTFLNLLLNSFNLRIEFPRAKDSPIKDGIEIFGNELQANSVPSMIGDHDTFKQFQCTFQFFSLRYFEIRSEPSPSISYTAILQPSLVPSIDSEPILNFIDTKTIYPLKIQSDVFGFSSPLLAFRTSQRSQTALQAEMELRLFVNPFEFTVPSHLLTRLSSILNTVNHIKEKRIGEKKKTQIDEDPSFVGVALLDKTLTLDVRIVDALVIVPSVHLPDILHFHFRDVAMKTVPSNPKTESTGVRIHQICSLFPCQPSDLIENSDSQNESNYLRSVHILVIFF
jgi:hypothetical protein